MATRAEAPSAASTAAATHPIAGSAAFSLRRSAALAATLSFLLPGLGQGWLGAMRRGLLLALPVLVLAGYAIGTVLSQDRIALIGLLIQPGVLLGLIALNLALLGWRVGAIVDAYLLARRRWPGARRGGSRLVAGVVLGALLAATFGTHVGAGYLGMQTYDTVSAIFAEPEPTDVPTPALPGGGAAPSETSPATPAPTPVPAWSDDGRLDLLLVGGDAGPGRWSLRTDTMIVLSVEVATGRAALFGIPRNMKNVPLPAGPAEAFPACECYPDLINGLYVYAGQHPELFRGGEDRGYYALQDAVSELVGRPLDGMAVVTLQGFVRLIDALGGLDISTPYGLYDATYPHEDGVHHEVIWIPAGAHHLDGHAALAFARSRHQDSDYDRMYRQQLVLTSLRRQICPSDLILRIPELLDVARDSLWTNLSVARVPDLLQLGSRVRVENIVSHQFWPPDIPEALDPAGIALIRHMVADAFEGPASSPAAPAGSPGTSASVRPTPTPAPDGGC